MDNTRTTSFFWIFILVYAALVLPRMVAPDAWLYTSLLTPVVVDEVGALIRVAALAATLWFVARAARQFDADNPAKLGWQLLKWGVVLYLLGQLVLNILGRMPGGAPYPSAADALFLLGTVVLTLALLEFFRIYLAGGLMGSASGPLMVGAVAAVVVAVINVVVLRPLLASDVPALETAVNVAYPILDSVLVVVAFMVFRITFRFRGGSIWEVWALLLSGFLCLAAGDILYAYFTAFNMSRLDPVMDVMFTWSYLLLAFGTALNYRLTRGS